MTIKHTLPTLPYSYDALEPYIDTKTMELHHTKHHQGYINKLNKALEEFDIDSCKLEDLFKKITNYPIAIRNNGGGHYNHSFFWQILSPHPQKKPKGSLLKDLIQTFGTIEEFKKQFNQIANSHFGSGWAWLIVDNVGKLQITSTPNQDNPLMPTSTRQGVPILGIDIWEHAYYLQYQNKRFDYIEAIWNVVNWKSIEKNYEKAFLQR